MKKKPEYQSNGIINVPIIQIEYKGFTIKAKLDMGCCPWNSKGNDIRRGYIIVENGCLVMPGGAWSHSVIEAKAMIDIYIEANRDAKIFWELLRQAQGYGEYEDI